ncbi:dihydroneopterin aldolase [Aliiglaciecola sp. M165]|uniref:dihydroneopterin aldolase n=1 Tax=Aliiglaciecola sp. M165 TaxID=2593649 RepID=UPI00117DBBCF|nr:dihydroneopterin aldolase [Aliiglaciecola sp. M165]TRY31994.1 dihydroneopterin aldolase [Aliiglaciecola sp. M165]
MDKIIIQGLTVKSLIGVYDWEREAKQALVVDIELSLPLSKAAKSDDVNDTIDYAALASQIEKLADDSSFELLEALANHLIEHCFTYPDVAKVKIAITKPHILPNANAVTVQMHANREDFSGNAL